MVTLKQSIIGKIYLLYLKKNERFPSHSLYNISYYCGAMYNGETGRSIKPRRPEHHTCLRTGTLLHFAFVERTST